MQKVFNLIPPEYRNQDNQDIEKPKERKLILIILGAVFLTLIICAFPFQTIPDTYFYPKMIAATKPVSLPKSKNIIKKIEINLSTHKLMLWEDEKKIAEFLVSTGKRRTPTKAGNFSVVSKHPVAYGGIKGQTWVMPYFLGIYIAGGQENGIHELPFINGRRESAWSLGHSVSHGCVRLPIGKAELVYNWAKIGTPVIIRY